MLLYMSPTNFVILVCLMIKSMVVLCHVDGL